MRSMLRVVNADGEKAEPVVKAGVVGADGGQLLVHLSRVDVGEVGLGGDHEALDAVVARCGARKGAQLVLQKPFRVVNGQALFLKNDELTTEDDEKGDQKIDAQGHLLGGREFKAPTFGSPWREDPDRQYMLSIDAARTSGFRDSLYYFRRNLQLVKLPLSQSEKEMLIDLGRLPNSLKSRSVTLVTARSAYKLHGAKMIKNGRWVIDDYYESRSLAEGRTSGELVGEITQEPVDPEQHHTSAAAPTTSASNGVYRVGGPSTLYGGAGDDIAPGMEIRLAAVRAADNELARMRRAAITTSQVATGAAVMAAGVGGVQPPGAPPAGIFAGVGGMGVPEPLDGDFTRLERRSEVAEEVYVGEPPLGWYEPHTGVWHYRADTQPTRAKLTHAPPTREALIADGILGAAKVGSNSWGIASVKTFMELPDRSEKPPGEFIWEG
ncbi:hypothetical protein BDV93DRAFT_305333 [Ceratobasidium sp. AG-I]|nr:hypothetical protein BDV93DRAFT_305333 [Ceratobasidium sp. AG-I]